MMNTVTVRPPRDARPVLLFFICLTVAALIVQTWWTIAQDRQLTIESQKRNSLITVRGLEERAAQTLEEISHVMARTADAVGAMDEATASDASAMHRILARESDRLRSIAVLWIANPEGVIRATSVRQPARETDIGNRQYIQFLHDHPDHGEIVIGFPDRGFENEWTIPVARNLYDRKKRRIGIAGASIRISYFSDFYRRVIGAGNATVTLRTNDGIVLIRSPHNESLLGQNISNSKVSQRIRSELPEGAFEDLSIFHGHARLFAYSKTTGFPVTTIYGVDIQHLLAPWHARSRNRILLSGATILFIGILTFFLLIHIRRLRRSEGSLTASEHRYRMLYESASDGILLLTRDQIYVDCNNAAVKLFCVPGKEYIIGKSADDFSAMEQVSAGLSFADRQKLVDAALAGKPQQFEWALMRDGRIHYSELTMSRVEMEQEPLLLCMFRDINVHKQSEELQEGQNRILHIIAGGAGLQKILDEIVLFIEQRAPHSRCMIMLLNEDLSRFTWGVGPSIPEAVMRGISEMEIKEGNGACSEVVLTRYPVMVDHIETDPSIHGVHELFTATDFVAYGCWPIMGKRGQILGIFSMFYDNHRIPSGDDVQLVGISTDLAGIAIESRWAEERIRHLAHYDDLTGLPNRFLYMQYLNKALAYAERSQLPVGVLFLDLDRFKNINDTFGHEAGDTVLRNLSVQFRKCLRESDTIARISGDEFIVLVDNYSDPRRLGEIAQRLLVEAARPFDIDGQECQLSVSIGIATYPVDGLNAQALLKNADIAMYRAKSTGKNNYQFYSSEMNTHTVERLTLEAKLRRAIERHEFVVHYQPKVDVLTGQVVGAEALVRWQHPEQGILLPGKFIGLAEEVGLIGPLGMLVLENACRDIMSFKNAGISFGRVAINLSGSQFNDIHLLRDVKNVVASYQVDPACLEFEITESMVMHNRDQAIELMDGIRKLGFSLSIDDFGTGYSSLAYLKRFPVDSVKIDKSFISDISLDQNDSAIVQAIIVMAHILGLKVTAEGVETFTQLKTLQQFGCDEYQGFHFSKAIPKNEFIALVQRQAIVSLA
ncbi:MAG: hypothetical protein JWQ21_3525 [Herminiimonas sp.]|nr:hypothetical protein [Herminiimonas sp.]